MSSDNVLKDDDTVGEKARSVSRGREAFHSSGRGGLGNIRRSSQSVSRDPGSGGPGTPTRRPPDGPDDFSPTRGREPATANFASASNIISTGRGGAGNMRSPSHDHTRAAGSDSREREIIQHHVDQEKTAVHSTGRGGIGNISRSRSRGPSSTLSNSNSPAPGTTFHSSGRGGRGNIVSGSGDTAGIEEKERQEYAVPEAHHSSGRGGVANISATPDPGVEHNPHHHGGLESTGRGGAGNIRDRSRSQDPEARNTTSEDQHRAEKEKHGIAGLWNKVTHATGGGSKPHTPPAGN